MTIARFGKPLSLDSFISLFHQHLSSAIYFLFIAQILRFRLNAVHEVLGVLFLFGWSK